MTPIHYISEVKQLNDDTIEIWQRFDGDSLPDDPIYT